MKRFILPTLLLAGTSFGMASCATTELTGPPPTAPPTAAPESDPPSPWGIHTSYAHITGFTQWECTEDVPYAFVKITRPEDANPRLTLVPSKDLESEPTPGADLDPGLIASIVHELVHVEQMRRAGSCERWHELWKNPDFAQAMEDEAYCRAGMAAYGEDRFGLCQAGGKPRVWQGEW